MTGFFHFYDCGVCVGVLQQPVSMPYDGLISFLLDNLEEECDGGQVSIPYDGLISFLRRMYQKFSGAYLVVSMPYDGLISFLLEETLLYLTHVERCQCPMTGLFHFYTMTNTHMEMKSSVSMPYDGLISFLPCEHAVYPLGGGQVSMPYDGLISFLHYAKDDSTILLNVSMPYDGLFSFLLEHVRRKAFLLNVSMPYDGLFSFLQPERRGRTAR